MSQRSAQVTLLTNIGPHGQQLCSTASPSCLFLILLSWFGCSDIHMQEILLYSSFWGKLTLLSIMSSKFIHHIEYSRISLFCFVTGKDWIFTYERMKFNTMFMAHTQQYIKILDTGLETETPPRKSSGTVLYTWGQQLQLSLIGRQSYLGRMTSNPKVLAQHMKNLVMTGIYRMDRNTESRKYG